MKRMKRMIKEITVTVKAKMKKLLERKKTSKKHQKKKKKETNAFKKFKEKTLRYY